MSDPRYALVNFMDRHTDACRCDLLEWLVFGGKRLSEIDWRGTRCKPGGEYNIEACGGCYCGKYASYPPPPPDAHNGAEEMIKDEK